MKKIKQLTVALAVTVLALTSSVHAQDDAYYINRDGRKIKVQDLVANEQGDLRVSMEGGGTQTVRRADYRSAYIPKPQQVALLEQIFMQGDYDKVLENVQGVFDRYKYLGWGGFLSYLKGAAQLEKDQAAAALRTLELGERFARDEDMEWLNMAKAKALMELGRYDDLDPILAQLKRAESSEAAAFSFMTQGILLADKGRVDEAILELMKTVLLFEPQGQLESIHETARLKLVELLKEKGDPSFKKFEN